MDASSFLMNDLTTTLGLDPAERSSGDTRYFKEVKQTQFSSQLPPPSKSRQSQLQPQVNLPSFHVRNHALQKQVVMSKFQSRRIDRLKYELRYKSS